MLVRRDAQYAGTRRELAGEIAPKQRRQQLAHGQIAGAAEQHQIEIMQLLCGRRAIFCGGQANSLQIHGSARCMYQARRVVNRRLYQRGRTCRSATFLAARTI